MSKIFISYRRSDSAAGYAMSLAQQLREEFGDARVFRDVRSIPPGVDFGDFIRRSLADCVVMLVVIGRRWATETDDAGRLRLHQPGDWVRQEVAIALSRGVRVIPVLVGGAALPRAEELPADLQPLLARNAVSLSDRNWPSETAEFAQALGEVSGVRSPLHRLRRLLQRTVAPSRGVTRARLVWGGLAVALASLGALGAAVEELLDPGTFFVGPATFLEPATNLAASMTVADPLPVDRAPDLTGTWVDHLGVSYAITQSGSEVVFSQLDGYGAGSAHGYGYLDGSTLQFSYQVNGAVISQGLVNIEANGGSMRGTVTDSIGLVTPIFLRRI